MSRTVISGALASAVAAAGGTFTASIPSGYNPGSFFLAVGHKLTIDGNELFYPKDFDIAVTTVITVTNKTASYAWPQGADFRLQMETMGDRSQLTVPMESPNALTQTIAGQSNSINVKAKLVPSTTQGYADIINLGAPIALDADGICAAQNVSAGATMTLNGALASAGAVTLDVPRCLSVDSGGADTAVLTIVGTDVYGRPMSEAITLNGTTQVNGKKAFKTVTSITSSATTSNSPFVGTTDILGLPVYMPSEGFVVAELQNGHPRGGAGVQTVPFVYGQTELLAPTGIELISPVNGYIVGARAIVQTAITTGGNIQVQVGTTPVAGLTLVFADAAAAGTIVSDTPTTPYSSTTVVTAGGRIRVLSDASFATAGAVNGFVEIVGTNGLLVPGVLTAGGSTTTSGDVRGTYVPSVACDGSTVFQLVAVLGDRYAGQAQNVSGA
jgi:hypothetical protein